MKKLLILFLLLGGVFGLSSCSEKENSTLLPSDIENIQAKEAPGSITLSWDMPQDESLKYVEICYAIKDKGKNYRKQVSKYADSFLVSDLLKKYGVIDFTLQAFNVDNLGGKIHRISAQAEKALPTFGAPEKIVLKAASMYTNAPFPTRPLGDLVDGNISTFFHSQWSTLVSLPHFIVIDLGESLNAFSFKSVNTNRAADSSWKTVEVYGSESYNSDEYFDGIQFVNGDVVDLSEAKLTPLGVFNEMSGEVSASYSSTIISTDTSVRWLWFKVTETTKQTPYFALAELEIFKYAMVSLE